jgi:hypothetical protein
MNLKKQRYFLLGIILAAGLFAGWNASFYTPLSALAGQNFSTARAQTLHQGGPQSADPDGLRPVHDQIHSFTALISPGSQHAQFRQPSGRARPDEKRHKKTRIREVFVAQFSLPLPCITYCIRQYPQLIAGPCLQPSTGNSSLRGPPVCS